MTSCGADILADTLFDTLTAGVSFTLPDVDLTGPLYQVPATVGDVDAPARIGDSALTTKVVDGEGTFDVVMTSIRAHLRDEYDKQRITGDQYTKAYIALTESALSNATQFLLTRDTAHYQALAARMAAMQAEVTLVTARVQLELVKVQLKSATFEARTNEAAFALTKMKLATEDVGYCTAKFSLENIAPEQLKLVKEQGETQRSQTMDTRSDGITPVTGSVGKQKDLYNQQITSYRRDAEVKAAKLFTDAWITMKTIDEGLLPPGGFTNTNLDDILSVLKTVNNLDPTP